MSENTTHLYGLFKDPGLTMWAKKPGQKGLLVPPLLFLVLVTFVANLSIMLCIQLNRRLQTITNLYVYSMAFCDLLVGLVVMNGMIVFTTFAYWPLGHHVCTLWVSFDFVLTTVSMYHFCLIAYDRYVALVKPLDYRKKHNMKSAAIKIALCWIFSMLVWIPAVVVYRTKYDQEPTDCLILPNKLYIFIQCFVVYYIPIVLMVYWYVSCLFVLKRRYSRDAIMMQTQERVLANQSDPTTPTVNTTATNSEEKCNTPETQANGKVKTSSFKFPSFKKKSYRTSDGKVLLNPEQLRNRARYLVKRKQHLKVIVTVGVVMGCFLFCWVPWCICWPIVTYFPGSVPLPVYEYVWWVTYLNSAITPLLYFVSNKDFRTAFRAIFPLMNRQLSTPL